jgi:hypothetical protein
MVANTVAAVGLGGDIARHISLAVLLTDDDFLSGWHLVLYGGVAGVALVLGAYAYAHGPRAPLVDLRAAAAGMATLTVGGVVDAVWHELYGVEAAFEALVSPPHLVIFAGLVMLMIAPIGVVAAAGLRRLDPVRSLVVALSVTSLLLVISLFTGYLTPLIGGSEFQAGAYVEPLVGTSYLDLDTSRGLGTTLWFGFVAAVAVTVVRARMAPVAGTWTLSFGLLALGPLIATGEVALPISAGLLVYGLLSDLTATRHAPHPVGTGAAVAAMWAMMFAVTGGRDDLLWGRELWGGVIATGFLVGAAVAGTVSWLTAPMRLPHR